MKYLLSKIELKIKLKNFNGNLWKILIIILFKKKTIYTYTCNIVMKSCVHIKYIFIRTRIQCHVHICGLA